MLQHCLPSIQAEYLLHISVSERNMQLIRYIPAIRNISLREKSLGRLLNNQFRYLLILVSFLSDRVARDTTGVRKRFSSESSTISLNLNAKQYKHKWWRCLPGSL